MVQQKFYLSNTWIKLGFPCYYQTRLPKLNFKLFWVATLVGMVVSLRSGILNQSGDLQQTAFLSTRHSAVRV
jgi:hypothetical protein